MSIIMSRLSLTHVQVRLLPGRWSGNLDFRPPFLPAYPFQSRAHFSLVAVDL